MQELSDLHNEFMEKHIKSAMTAKGLAKIQQHREKGDRSEENTSALQ